MSHGVDANIVVRYVGVQTPTHLGKVKIVVDREKLFQIFCVFAFVFRFTYSHKQN